MFGCDDKITYDPQHGYMQKVLGQKSSSRLERLTATLYKLSRN